MKINIFFVLVFISFSLKGFTQNKYTISGSIKSKRTGETLIGVSIQTNQTGATSNEYGYYAITLPQGEYQLQFSAIGYTTETQKIHLQADLKLDVLLPDLTQTLEDVLVKSSSKNRSITNPQMGLENISIAEIKNLPVIFGEKDLLKSIQLLPGIKSAGEGNSGFFVRGGAGDQNLILLDEAPVYNASHLLGFFSTFNSDAIKDVALYKGGMPAQYGGRLSSVLDIKMNEGNNQNLGVSGGIGLISSKINIEGPIQKSNSSFLLSGRRTYADMFLKLSKDSAINQNRVYFYDVNAKMNYQLGEKDRLFVSGYFGKDYLKLGKTFGISWGNATATLRWNHIFNKKLFSNTSLISSTYNYQIDILSGTSNFEIFSQIRDWNIKNEYQWFVNEKNNIRFGINSIYHIIRPGEVKANEQGSINQSILQKRFSLENALYFTNTWKATKQLNITYGLRFSTFSVLGKGDFYTLNQALEVTDTLSYKSGEIVKTYYNPEPRLALSYIINSATSLKLSYIRNVQNLHLLSNSTSSSPTDKWLANTNIIKPELSDLYALGFYKNIFKNSYEITVEIYFKKMYNQIDYIDAANIFVNSNAIETQLLFGKGRAYGLEFLLKKKQGSFTGWISYTLAKTERKINGINQNKWYNARQDRTHDIAIVAMYQLSQKWYLSANWIFYTGDAVTFPAGKYTVDNQTVYYYTTRNKNRMPNYHRMDVGATKTLQSRKKFKSELVFSIYNVYARENAYAINFRDKKDNPQITETVRFSLFKLVPSIAYNFKF